MSLVLFFVTVICGHMYYSGINRENPGLFGATSACVINTRHAGSDGVITR